MIIRKQIGLVEGEASAAEVVAACHERTKHHFHVYAASLGYMDWATTLRQGSTRLNGERYLTRSGGTSWLALSLRGLSLMAPSLRVCRRYIGGKPGSTVSARSVTASTTLDTRLEGLPLPAESAVFELNLADFAAPFAKAYALLWHLVRRPEYSEKLTSGPHIGSDGKAVLMLRLHPKHDGSFCLGLEAKNPLQLLAENSELAHFHRVASNEAAACEVCRILAELTAKQFDAEVSITVAEKKSGHPA